MSTWLDKPDWDGLWWKQVNKQIHLTAVRGKHYRFVLHGDDSLRFSVDSEPAKWQRCTLTQPEPYKPPQPPKVEWFMLNNGERFILQTPLSWFAFDKDGECRNSGRGKADYTDIKPLESPP